MKEYYKGPASDHFDGVKFYNPWQRRTHLFWSFLRWRLQARPKPWPNKIFVLPDTPPKNVAGDSLRVSFVGHSTVLIQTQNMNILTDPIWSERASPFQWLGPKRRAAPGISWQQLPKIDLILISHSHYDHLDIPTLKKLWDRDKPTILTPLGNDAIIHSKHPEIKVQALDWHQSKTIGEDERVKVYLEPAQHWSSRNLWDHDKALWGAFVIDSPSGKIYFAGDTGYGDGEPFRQALQKFGEFRFAMLPVGAYEPRWFMKYAHMSPEDAILAYHDLGEPYTMGVHVGTFQLSDEGYEDPSQDLAIAKQKYNVGNQLFRILKVGEVWDIPF